MEKMLLTLLFFNSISLLMDSVMLFGNFLTV